MLEAYVLRADARDFDDLRPSRSIKGSQRYTASSETAVGEAENSVAHGKRGSTAAAEIITVARPNHRRHTHLEAVPTLPAIRAVLRLLCEQA